MDGLQAYRYYLAVKLHFTQESYDIFKYDGRVKLANGSFERRNDRKLFDGLAYRYPSDQELIFFLVSNFAYGHDDVLYDFEIGKKFYTEWIKRKESRTYLFTQELKRIISAAEDISKDDIFFQKSFPEVINMLFRKELSVETLAIIHSKNQFLDHASNQNNILIKDVRHRIKKSVPFVKFQKDEIDPIFSEFERVLDINSNAG